MRFILIAILLMFTAAPADAARHKHGHATKGRASASINCVVPELRDLIRRVESKFGPVTVISTCRPGAKIRGTGRPSLHASGRAVDFRSKRKHAIVAWLRQQGRYGTMVYKNASHIHVDVGRGGYYAVGWA